MAILNLIVYKDLGIDSVFSTLCIDLHEYCARAQSLAVQLASMYMLGN